MIEKLDYTMPNVFQLAALEKECFGKDAWSLNSLRAEFANQFSHFFAKTVDGKIVGYVCARIICEEAQISNIAVSVAHRRQGIATELLNHLADYAKEHNCERCELEVNTANIPAVELYKKCGYEVAGTRPNFYRRCRYATRDAYTMVLTLVNKDSADDGNL